MMKIKKAVIVTSPATLEVKGAFRDQGRNFRSDEPSIPIWASWDFGELVMQPAETFALSNSFGCHHVAERPFGQGQYERS